MSVFRAARLVLALKCKESARLVSESLDRELTPSERWAVKLHLMICRSCRRYRRQLWLLRQVIRRGVQAISDAPLHSAAATPVVPADQATLSDEARQRILRALNDHPRSV